jgi:hypothetical protein
MVESKVLEYELEWCRQVRSVKHLEEQSIQDDIVSALTPQQLSTGVWKMGSQQGSAQVHQGEWKSSFGA